jgi:hypothetical protein
MMQRTRSQLHLQLGQEVIYVLMALGILTTLVMLANAERLRIPLPDCALPGHTGCVEPTVDPPNCMKAGRGPCYSQNDLPECMRSGRDRCMIAVDLPDCMKSGHGPCYSQKDLPDCMMPGRGPCTGPPPERPPILNLTEGAGFKFTSGSYVISPDFRMKLGTKVAPEILKLGAEHHARVVEVVGHTDSVPMSSSTSLDRRSSLDQKLNTYVSGDKALSGEKAVETVDNVGLGMMRAASVVRALKELPELQRSGFVFLAMSAGQTTGPDDRPIGSESGPPAGDEKRRRVEIRLRRSFYEP